MMAKQWSSVYSVAFALAFIICCVAMASSQPYGQEEYGTDEFGANDIDYFDNFRDLIHQAQKKRVFYANDYVKRRLCIPPQMSCNTLPNSCCPGTTCRCNLWGQNCRCLRMGFFQRWGRRK